MMKQTNSLYCDSMDSFKSLISPILGSVASRTFIVDDSSITADRIPVHWMVDGTVSNAVLLHAADDTFKRIQIFSQISIQFHVGDMSCIGQRMIWSFDLDLIEGRQIVVNRNMERIRIVFSVSDTFYCSVFFSVNTYKICLKVLQQVLRSACN